MLQLVYTTRFKKDFKRVNKRGLKQQKLQTIIELLTAEKNLPAKYRDHELIGNYIHHRECHIEPDWLLIYRVVGKELRLERTGSHSDLF